MSLDLARLPGKPADHRRYARALPRGVKPIRLQRSDSGWHVIVLGTDIGCAPTHEAAVHAAHTIGRYRLDLGDFVDTYVESNWHKERP